MNHRITIVFSIGMVGLLVGCLGLLANFYYGSRYIVARDIPGSNELLDGVAMGFMVGLTASIVSFPLGLVLRRFGKPNLGFILMGGSVLLGALAIVRYWYVVTAAV